MTPSPQEVAALVESTRFAAGWFPDASANKAKLDASADALTAQAARIAELERECAELRKDKERLDWLAGQHELERRAFSDLRSNKQVTIVWMDSKLRANFADGPDFRSAIDAAMTAKPTEARHE